MLMKTRNLTAKKRQSGSEISVIKGELIGKGGLGKAYHAKLDIPLTHEMYPILSKCEWIYKEVPIAYFIASEPTIAARYFSVSSHWKNHQFTTITTSSKKGWIAEYIPGKPFSRKNTADLNFNQIMQLVFELVVRTNLFHHHTIRGNGIIHGDINRENIHFYVYPDGSKLPEIDYFDYGLSMELPKDDSPNLARKNKSILKNFCLNKEYFAPEAYEKKIFGIKTDIYMLAETIKEVLLNRFPVTTPNISSLVIGYLARAKVRQYQKRPDSDEFMKFFTLVNQFYKIDEYDFCRKNRVAAKLAVLQAQKTNVQMSPDSEMTWGQYYLHDVGDFNEFDNDIDIAIRCIVTYKNEIDWTQIVNNPDFVKSIARLDKMNMIDKTVIAFLYDQHDICHQFAQGSLSVLPMLVDRSVETLRIAAITQIQYRLSQAKTVAEVSHIELDLESMAANNEIDYLYARQGYSFSLHQHQWKGEDVSGTWLKVMKMIKQQKIALAYPLIEFEDFQAAYKENYNAAFFKNPWSKMKTMLDEYLYHTMDEVLQHARNNPDSRTARVLKTLALTKAATITHVENKRNVI